MFKKAILVAFTAASLVALDVPGAAIAGEQPNVLIVGEDADLDTVPRHNRIFDRVMRAVETEMQAQGFRIYDETVVGMDISDPNRVRRQDAELVTLARRVPRAPLDVVTIFQIYAHAEKNPLADIMDLRVRIPGRMINVHTGEALANFEKDYGVGDLPPLPYDCDTDCVLEHVGKQAARLGADLGAVLAIKLDQLSPEDSDGIVFNTGEPKAGDDSCDSGLSTAYTLTFRGFSTEELLLIEDYLMAFAGYEHMRPVSIMTTESEYWYESCSDIARLNRNLLVMTDHMGVEAALDMKRSGFEIDKLRAPAKR